MDEELKNQRSPRPAIIEGAIAKIPLGVNAKDGYVLVDARLSFLDEHKWHLGVNGYASTNLSGKSILLHHILSGDIAKGMCVDHMNLNKLDNRIENLRIVTRAQNNTNVGKKLSSKSMYKGVIWHKPTDSWTARVVKSGVVKSLGYFKDELKAAVAYDNAAIEIHGEYANTNGLSLNTTKELK